MVWVSRPLLIQTAFMIVLGGGALVVGVLFSREMPAQKEPVHSPAAPSEEFELQPMPPKEAPELEEEPQLDDDTRPTGMFG